MNHNNRLINEWGVPLLLFLLFLAVSLPGVGWGAPALWNPDEMIWRVSSALRGELVFDVTEPDFNYPSLPKYVMYLIGTITYALGKSDFAFIVSARAFSAFLGGIGGMLIYSLARLAGGNKAVSLWAGLFYIASSVAAANSRFAHNDLYLQFFTILTVYFILKYQQTKLDYWTYAAFFSVGLATSCKYTGASLIFLPIIVYLIENRNRLLKHWLSMAVVLFLGGLMAYVGYGIGTPIAFVDPINYFPKILVVLQNLRSYGFNSGTSMGIYGQWAVLRSAVGDFEYFLFLGAFLWHAVRLLLWKAGKISLETAQAKAMTVFILALLIFDLPYLISINYIARYFIPFVPFLSVMSAAFLHDLLSLAKERKWNFVQPLLTIVVLAGMAYSALRLGSIALLFLNDARIPATEYIASIRGYQKSIEYTLYPPYIKKRQFHRAHNYPIYFVEWEGDTVPTGGRIEYNQAEKGLLERNTDYFVIDSFTYSRFYTDSICATTPGECSFFKDLIDGKIASFTRVKTFHYSLPPFLPPVTVSAVNPDILIFERVR